VSYTNSVPLARLFVALVGIATIVQVAVSLNNADAFWALILIVWLVRGVHSDKNNISDLIVRAVLASAGIVAVGVGANATHHVAVLWALILINWAVDAVCDILVEG